MARLDKLALIAVLACAAAGGVPAWAGEHVLLTNGFLLEIERHQTDGDQIRLFTKTGIIEMAASRVRQFLPDDGPPPPPPANPSVSPARDATRSSAASSSASSSPSPDPRRLLDQAAERYGVPAAFLHSVARTESAYRVDAVSHKGAIGVMQLMPATAALLGADPHDPEQNIDAGARHLRELLEQYNGSAHKALSAYNAGAGAVARYGGVPPYRETVNYVDRVLRTYQSLSAKSK